MYLNIMMISPEYVEITYQIHTELYVSYCIQVNEYDYAHFS